MCKMERILDDMLSIKKRLEHGINQCQSAIDLCWHHADSVWENANADNKYDEYMKRIDNAEDEKSRYEAALSKVEEAIQLLKEESHG